MSKCEFFTNKIEYLGCPVSGQGISPMSQKNKSNDRLVTATNITETRHMVSLIGYYRKFFLYLVTWLNLWMH